MQLTYVYNPQYIRGINVTACSAIELGAMSKEGDVLRDAVNGSDYEIAGHSLNEGDGYVSLAIRGKHRELVGRLLFNGDITQLRCLLLRGSSDSWNIEADTAVSGLVALASVDTPGILRVDRQGQFQLLVVIKKKDIVEGSVVFSFMNMTEGPSSLRLNVSEVKEVSESGPIFAPSDSTASSSSV